MSLFENFPFTNLHQLNLDWLIAEVKKCYSPDNPPEAMVISVNGESGEVILYKNAHVALPDITEEQWNLYRGSANKITGIEFNKDNPATRINGNQRFVIYDSGNPPPYPVIAVNGETGNVILYEEPYAVFPDVEGNNWGLERKLNTNTADETRVGIMFDDTGKAYITHDEDATQLLTIEDIPSSSGVVAINGKTGIVTLNGANTKINSNSNDSIETTINNVAASSETADSAIKNIIAYKENSNVATRNYLKGEYIIIGNTLYRAKNNITDTDTLSSSNLDTITNIGTEIKNLFESIDSLPTVENSLTATTSGKVLDARQGKILDDIKSTSKEGAIPANGTVNIDVSDMRICLIFVGRGSVSTTAYCALHDQWGNIATIATNANFSVSSSGDIITITNNALSYVDYLIIGHNA